MSGKSFEIGAAVRWLSQANASWKRKAGVIEQIVPAGKLPDRDRFHSLYKNAGVGMPRAHESYVVSVQEGNRKPKYYWPRVSALEVVE